MRDKYRLKSWQELELGGVINKGGNAVDYRTGSWRTQRPVWNKEICIHCLTCWVFCPEDAFVLVDGKTKSGRDRKEIGEINYDYCKGCGLCVKECPVNKKGGKTVLTLVREET